MSDLSSFNHSLVAPPPLPPDSVYTSCYCEENIYLLAQHFREQAGEAQVVTRKAGVSDSDWFWEIYVIFISNDGKTVRNCLPADSNLFIHALSCMLAER